MIDTSELAFPKPGHAAGRVVYKGKKYSTAKRRKLDHQAGRCARCPQPILDAREAPLHHPHGRGMGGGKRDDRDTEIVCVNCHQSAPIERRETWDAPPADPSAAGTA